MTSASSVLSCKMAFGALCAVNFPFPSENRDRLIELSGSTSEKVKYCASKWLQTIKQPEKTVAEVWLSTKRDDCLITAHRRCYERFTNVLKKSSVDNVSIIIPEDLLQHFCNV